MPIAQARGLADGTTVTVGGVLTTALGALESGRAAFIQDESGGIALYLDAPVTGTWPAGTTIVVHGSLDSRYAQRTLRIAEASIVVGAGAGLPEAPRVATATAGEPLEGTRIQVSGTISGAPDALADGLGITIDDGTGPVRAVIGTDALAGRTVASGMIATVTGPLGQRDSSGTGASGYRIHATLTGELALVSPSPTPSPTSSASPTAPPAPTPTTTPGPTAAPTSPPYSITRAHRDPLAVRHADARRRPRASGRSVTRVRPASSSPRRAASGLRSCSPSAMRTPASSSICRRALARSLAGPCSRSPERWPRHTGNSRSAGQGRDPGPRHRRAADADRRRRCRTRRSDRRPHRHDDRAADGKAQEVGDRRHHPCPRAHRCRAGQGHGGRLEPDHDRFAEGGRIVSGRRVRRPASDTVGRARRLPHLGPRNADLALATPRLRRAAATCRHQPGASGSTAETVTIARALRIADRIVAIDAIVTAPATLLDATGRRIVVQDGSARSKSCSRAMPPRRPLDPGSTPRAGSASPMAPRGCVPSGSTSPDVDTAGAARPARVRRGA